MRPHLNYRGKAEADEDFVDWVHGLKAQIEGHMSGSLSPNVPPMRGPCTSTIASWTARLSLMKRGVRHSFLIRLIS